MSYNLRSVFRLNDKALQNVPTDDTLELSINLMIERHTIEKAVRAETGQSFRSFRREMAFKVASAYLTREQIKASRRFPTWWGKVCREPLRDLLSLFADKSPWSLEDVSLSKRKRFSSQHGQETSTLVYFSNLSSLLG